MRKRQIWVFTPILTFPRQGGRDFERKGAGFTPILTFPRQGGRDFDDGGER